MRLDGRHREKENPHDLPDQGSIRKSGTILGSYGVRACQESVTRTTRSKMDDREAHHSRENTLASSGGQDVKSVMI